MYSTIIKWSSERYDHTLLRLEGESSSTGDHTEDLGHTKEGREELEHEGDVISKSLASVADVDVDLEELEHAVNGEDEERATERATLYNTTA